MADASEPTESPLALLRRVAREGVVAPLSPSTLEQLQGVIRALEVIWEDDLNDMEEIIAEDQRQRDEHRWANLGEEAPQDRTRQKNRKKVKANQRRRRAAAKARRRAANA